MVPQPEPLLILDTTLRDGERSPGCSMTRPEKLRVARALAELGVDVIEAGLPGTSRNDWENVNAIAREVAGPIICGLAHCTRADIELAAQALQPAARRRLHVFHGTSGIDQEETLRTAVEGVRIARELCDDVEFSPEDASRTELEFLAHVVEAAIEAGATTVNIPDTTGYAVPDEFSELFRYLRQNVRGIDRVRLSVHCHDDLGMAVANSLTAVVAGARQVECTINGIGERAGACSLEEVVLAIKMRDAFFNLQTNVDASRLYPTSRLVSSITGMPIPRSRSSYEILQQRSGSRPPRSLPLGKHSGRDALSERVRQLGFELGETEFGRVLEAFTALAGRKPELFDGDIEALVLKAEDDATGPWTLEELTTVAGTAAPAKASVRLTHRDGRSVERSATGDGPVDAAFKAIEAATGIQVTLRQFEVRAVTEGEDAQGEAVIHVEHGLRTYHGSSVSTNIVESASRAFLEVINRIELSKESEIPTTKPRVVAAH